MIVEPRPIQLTLGPLGDIGAEQPVHRGMRWICRVAEPPRIPVDGHHRTPPTGRACGEQRNPELIARLTEVRPYRGMAGQGGET